MNLTERPSSPPEWDKIISTLLDPTKETRQVQTALSLFQNAFESEISKLDAIELSENVDLNIPLFKKKLLKLFADIFLVWVAQHNDDSIGSTCIQLLHDTSLFVQKKPSHLNTFFASYPLFINKAVLHIESSTLRSVLYLYEEFVIQHSERTLILKLAEQLTELSKNLSRSWIRIYMNIFSRASISQTSSLDSFVRSYEFMKIKPSARAKTERFVRSIGEVSTIILLLPLRVESLKGNTTNQARAIESTNSIVQEVVNSVTEFASQVSSSDFDIPGLDSNTINHDLQSSIDSIIHAITILNLDSSAERVAKAIVSLKNYLPKLNEIKAELKTMK